MGDNGGVHAQNGFALQRNTAIFLLLGNYAEKFKDKKYFIYLEHHEDFLFCFLNENEQVNEIEAYQSKKSSQKWTLNKKFYEDILTKLLQTGLKLRADSISKTDTYGHSLYFSSNQTIELKEKNGNTSIDETNTLLKYKDLSNEIRDKLKKNIPSEVLTELENLGFIFIDLPKKPDEQENQLAGKFDKIFGKEINDKRAALSTIITLFRKIETTFNQGGKAELSDKSKRVSNQEIENAFEILTTKSKCFNYWRDKKVDISKILKIRIQDRETFELAFESAFDLFKSIKEAEHQKIFNFVKKQIENLDFYSEEEAVDKLFDLFKKSHSTKFTDLQLKAILFAALFEVLNIKENNQ